MINLLKNSFLKEFFSKRIKNYDVNIVVYNRGIRNTTCLSLLLAWMIIILNEISVTLFQLFLYTFSIVLLLQLCYTLCHSVYQIESFLESRIKNK